MSINQQPKHIHIRLGEGLHRRIVEATRRRGYGSMNTWILDALDAAATRSEREAAKANMARSSHD